MLRGFLLGCAALALLCGIGLLALARDPGGFGLLLFGSLVLASLILERRYKQPVPRGKGQPTNERFVDPVTGELMEVWYDAATGERSYVRSKDAAPR